MQVATRRTEIYEAPNSVYVADFIGDVDVERWFGTRTRNAGIQGELMLAHRQSRPPPADRNPML